MNGLAGFVGETPAQTPVACTNGAAFEESSASVDFHMAQASGVFPGITSVHMLGLFLPAKGASRVCFRFPKFNRLFSQLQLPLQTRVFKVNGPKAL